MRIATVGCGRMGANATTAMVHYAPEHLRILSHLAAARALHLDIELAAADISADSVAQAKKNFNLDYTSTDYRELIDTFRPDILTIATRTPEKRKIISYAIEKGIKAFHVEKPLCNNTNELAQLEHLMDNEDVLLTSGCLRRFLTPFQKARDHFMVEKVDNLQTIEVAMGRAALMWTQFHALDLILFYAGKRRLKWVQANLDEIIWGADQGIPTIENDPLIISATLQFEDGFTGHITQNVGNTLRLGGRDAQVEIFADGRSSRIAEKIAPEDPYLTQSKLYLKSGDLSGTQAPLQYLIRARENDDEALDIVRKSKTDFFKAQRILFKMLISDLNGGRREDFTSGLQTLCIMGKSFGNYA